MRVHFLQHVPFEGLGSIERWIDERSLAVSSTQLYRGDSLPELDEFDSLIVMGGPMGVCDLSTYPWLSAEKQFIGEAIRHDKVVLGVCLGAQLIASALGARVYANPEREIGWFPVECTEADAACSFGEIFPTGIEAFHWHGDTFDLPDGAVHLARSAACENQAFSFGQRVLALQFHLETTPTAAMALIEHCADELRDGRYVQQPLAMLSRADRFEQANEVMFRILDDLHGRR